MGHFRLLAKTKLDKIKKNQIIKESDFSLLTPSGNFIQLEYIEKEVSRHYDVKPGIWSIVKIGPILKLEHTSFIKDKILDDLISTKDITNRINLFFERFHVYYDHGFEVPKRAMLFFGPAGSGKSVCLSKAVEKYGNDGKTAVVVWHTDQFDAGSVKDFIKSFKYKGVERLILIAEDIGGVEVDRVRMRSDSSLLALLDNQEKTFTIPVLILATTNFPEVFMGNLTNRPNRFDDKIEVGFPPPDSRQKLLEFFTKVPISKEAIDLIRSNKCEEFTPAHIREVVIRSAIYDKTAEVVIKEMIQEIKYYKDAFEKKRSMGMGM